MDKDADGIRRALEKRAYGYDAEEVVEEYALDGGEERLVKRKVTKKNVPPDLSAIRMLMDGGAAEEMSDEELMREREKLLSLLKEKGGNL